MSSRPAPSSGARNAGGGGSTGSGSPSSSSSRPASHPSSSSSSSCPPSSPPRRSHSASNSTPSASAPSSGPPPSIGLNLRVTGYCNQGGRKYMEDVFSVAYQQTEDEKDLEYAFFGIFDGHGGREAAVFAKEHLMDFIVRQKNFWVDDDEAVLRAVHEGFVQTHQAMWKELENWPKTPSGLPSTAGTTASVAFIRRGKIYIGHVGDSAIVLGVQDPGDRDNWMCHPLTRDHKPESQEESRRIQESGGKVVCKSGVPRVVWNRPRMGHRGPVRRSTHIDEIPFLAVARSLGDLWSYNSEEDVFVVSPEPDTYVYPIDISKHRCLILGTDGAWNMLTPPQAVRIVCDAEKSNELHMLNPTATRQWINPSKRLVDKAIEKWNGNNLRADNTSVVTVMLDPPGPPRAQVLKRQRELAQMSGAHLGSHAPGTFSSTASASRVINADRGSVALVTNTTPEEPEASGAPAAAAAAPSSSLPAHPASTSGQPSMAQRGGTLQLSRPHPSSVPSLPSSSTFVPTHQEPSSSSKGVSIISRFPNSKTRGDETHSGSVAEGDSDRQRRRIQPQPVASASNLLRLSTATTAVVDSTTNVHHHGRGKRSHAAAASSSAPTASCSSSQQPRATSDYDDIQCNVVSSSDDDSPMKEPHAAAANAGKRRFPRKGVLKESSRLSRELSALQLDSPKAWKSSSSSAGRNRSGRPRSSVRSDTEDEDESRSSDVENEQNERQRQQEQQHHRQAGGSSKRRLRSSSALKDVEQQCWELNAKIKSIERKVAKKARQLNQEVRFIQSNISERTGGAGGASDAPGNPHFLRSAQQESQEQAHQPRSLRPRTPAKASAVPKRAASTPGSGRKRKVAGDASSSQPPVAKSPKTTAGATAVRGARPVVTRSRTARVLQLRHK